jgi:hypothetical protein
MGCCYSEPESATVYHEIKPTVIPTYTNIIRTPSVRLPPVTEYHVTPSAPPESPIMRAEETFRKPDSDLESLITPVKTPLQPLKKKKKSQV